MDNTLRQRVYNAKLPRYVFVGVLNTVISYLAFIILLSVGLHYLPASLLSYILGVGNSYLWNKYFTFRQSAIRLPELLKFISVYAGQYLIGLIGLVVLVEIFRLGPILAQTIILIVSVTVTFFAHHHWTFKDDSGVK